MIDNTATTLYPGGILNTGFALIVGEGPRPRRQASLRDRRPALGARQRIQQGDRTCAANQALHAEAVDLLAKIRANSYYVPSVADPLAPVTFVHRIKVPVFLACQWTDEQTGGHCPTSPSISPARIASGSRSPTAPTSIRSTRRRSRAGSTSSSSTSRARRPQLVPAVKALAPTIFKAVVGRPRRPLPERPDPVGADLRGRAGRIPAPAARCGSCSTTAPAAPPGCARCPASSGRSRVSRCRHHGARSWYLGGGRRAVGAGRRPRPGPTASRGTRGPAPDGLHRRHRLGPRWACGPRPPPTTGSRTRPGPPLAYVSRAARARHGGRSAAARCRLWVKSLRAERRPAGHGLRGPARREGDVRAERLAARQRAQARPREEHAARAGPELPPGRPSATATRTLGKGRPSRCTTRATSTGADRGSGSRSARPAAPSRSGRSRIHSPPAAHRCRLLIRHG